jgi:excinuclease ABC subunit A
LKRKKLEDKLKVLLQQGFREFLWVTKWWLDEWSAQTRPEKTTLIIDRIVVKEEEEFYNRLEMQFKLLLWRKRYLLFTKNSTKRLNIQITLS